MATALVQTSNLFLVCLRLINFANKKVFCIGYIVASFFLSGNEVDQLFSILTNEFKNVEIPDVETLMKIIADAPMKPKPIVESMQFSWDWKTFIEPRLNPLENHTLFNSFSITNEDGEVGLRYKKLPQSLQYGPAKGIQLVKTFDGFEPVKASEFRVETLQLDKLVRGLLPYFSTMDLGTKIRVQSRWESRKKILEGLPAKREGLPRMDLCELPTRSNSEPKSSEVEEDHRQVQGTFYEDIVEEGDLEKEICVNMDVCVYTVQKRRRPWVGRVITLKGRENFVINWYEKDPSTKCGKYVSMKNEDGTLYTSEMDLATVMLWSFTVDRQENSFVITPVWQDCLKKRVH